MSKVNGERPARIRLPWADLDAELVKAQRRVQRARGELNEAEHDYRTLIRMISDPLFAIEPDYEVIEEDRRRRTRIAMETGVQGRIG